jgi:hypothetical protein
MFKISSLSDTNGTKIFYILISKFINFLKMDFSDKKQVITSVITNTLFKLINISLFFEQILLNSFWISIKDLVFTRIGFVYSKISIII